MTTTKTTKTVRTPPQRLETGKDLTSLSKALKSAKTPESQGKALVAMRSAGASYAQIAEVLGVVPMTARSRYLALTK